LTSYFKLIQNLFKLMIHLILSNFIAVKVTYILVFFLFFTTSISRLMLHFSIAKVSLILN